MSCHVACRGRDGSRSLRESKEKGKRSVRLRVRPTPPTPHAPRHNHRCLLPFHHAGHVLAFLEAGKKKSLAIISPGQLGHCNTFFVVNFKKVLHDSRYFVEFLHEAAEGQVEEGW
jgi:hypothetical protein